MKLKEFYEKAVQAGIDNDPRGKSSVKESLKAKKGTFEALKADEKKLFDKESLTNPYSDTRILNGKGSENIRTVLAGIDIEVGEIMLADSMRSKGKKIDLVMAHHPEGRAIATLYDVMSMQSDILSKFGVPINVAENLMEGRMREVERRLMPMNHTRAVDAARLVDIPFMCVHTPADNMVVSYLQKMFDSRKPRKLGDIIKMLLKIPEYEDAAMNGSGPKILLGSERRTAGKVFVDMTGGTEGSKDIFESLTGSGINTIVCMHLSEEHRKEAEKHKINVIIAGHISSDNLGINLLLDKVIGKGKIDVIQCSGFRRVKRT
ncbi:MAG: NGG1p interacting factor NIF3 [Nitrospirota bacterium]|nr:MAG: NGG1p interacting factor NIF3 [Nitrospirota bacterium]